LLGQAGDQQQGGEVLAALVATHGDRSATQLAAVDGQRRAAAGAVDGHAELTQAIDQIGDRALGHRLVADEGGLPRHQDGGGGKEAHRRTAVADEDGLGRDAQA